MAALIKLSCSPQSFRPAPDARVRWLDQELDFDLALEAWQALGVVITRAEWADWHRQSYRYCGIVENHQLVSSAAVWAYSPAAWELAAVHTRASHRRHGYARSVCAFAIADILARGCIATCTTRADNTPMLRLATSLGFQSARGT
jgi:ribosomal protein S18 acetylase RimI-like enzyme